MTNTLSKKASPRRPSALLLGGGVLVIAIGFGLPQLMSNTAETTPNDSISADPAPPLGPALARLAGSLVLVCGLCVIVTKLVNRRGAAASGPMQAVASLRINARCVLHLIQNGERRLLVGMDASGVKALLELPTPLPVEANDALPADVLAFSMGSGNSRAA